MSTIRTSVHIQADPATVWADIERLESHVEWMADAESIEFVGEQRSGTGTVMKVLTRVGPLRTTDVIRVTSWDPPSSIHVVHEGLVTGTGKFILEPDSGGTLFTWEETLEMPWFFGGRAGTVVAGPVLNWVWRRNLTRLAARFER